MFLNGCRYGKAKRAGKGKKKASQQVRESPTTAEGPSAKQTGIRNKGRKGYLETRIMGGGRKWPYSGWIKIRRQRFNRVQKVQSRLGSR